MQVCAGQGGNSLGVIPSFTGMGSTRGMRHFGFTRIRINVQAYDHCDEIVQQMLNINSCVCIVGFVFASGCQQCSIFWMVTWHQPHRRSAGFLNVGGNSYFLVVVDYLHELAQSAKG